MDDEVLFVKVRTMDSDRLLDLIADLSWGKWEPTPTGRRLVRDKVRLHREKDLEAEVTGKRIQAEMPSALRGTAPWDAQAVLRRNLEAATTVADMIPHGNVTEAQRTLALGTPAGRALARLILDTPPARLGSVAPRSTAHYASDSNLMQISLGNRASAITGTFAQEENEYGAAIASLPANRRTIAKTSVHLTSDFLQPISGAVHVVMKLQRLRPDQYSADAGFFDENGVVNAIGSSAFQLSPYPLPPELNIAKLTQTRWLPSPAALESVGRAQTEGNHDPLLAVGEGLGAVERTLGVSIVASIPDDALGPCGELLRSHKEPTPAEFLDSVRREMRFTVEDGVVIGKPAFGWNARATRVDRKAFDTLLATLARKGFVDFDDLGSYYRVQPSGNDMESWRLNLEDTDDRRPWLSSLKSWNRQERLSIRIWTGLDADTRQRLVMTRAIPLDVLGDDARRDLTTLIFDGDSSFHGLSAMRPAFTDPTLSLPDGLPESVACGASLEVTPQVFSTSKGRIAKLMTCEEIGEIAAQQARGRGTSFEPIGKIAFLPSTERRVNLAFRIANGFEIALSFTDDTVDANAAPVLYTGLPEPQRRAIQSSIDRVNWVLDFQDSQARIRATQTSPPPP